MAAARMTCTNKRSISNWSVSGTGLWDRTTETVRHNQI